MEENLDELIAEFTSLCDKISELSERKRIVADKLAERAFASRAGSNTVRLASTNGCKIKVQFRSKVEYDCDQLIPVVNLIGKDRFDALFKTKIEFTAQKRNLNDFLATVTSDEAIETAKQLIREATVETQQLPYVSLERSADEAAHQ
ncbi:MAG TPA: hypothetical protein VFC63_00345 [Blastocatellia bacterium]|nr:hypothetical protein [Blastocatellia bacterium]